MLKSKATLEKYKTNYAMKFHYKILQYNNNNTHTHTHTHTHTYTHIHVHKNHTQMYELIEHACNIISIMEFMHKSILITFQEKQKTVFSVVVVSFFQMKDCFIINQSYQVHAKFD